MLVVSCVCVSTNIVCAVFWCVHGNYVDAATTNLCLTVNNRLSHLWRAPTIFSLETGKTGLTGID